MRKSIAMRAKKPTADEHRLRCVALALCNAERIHAMLDAIAEWDDLTDEAQEHYRRLAVAAVDAVAADKPGAADEKLRGLKWTVCESEVLCDPNLNPQARLILTELSKS